MKYHRQQLQKIREYRYFNYLSYLRSHLYLPTKDKAMERRRLNRKIKPKLKIYCKLPFLTCTWTFKTSLNKNHHVLPKLTKSLLDQDAFYPHFKLVRQYNTIVWVHLTVLLRYKVQIHSSLSIHCEQKFCFRRLTKTTSVKTKIKPCLI